MNPILFKTLELVKQRRRQCPRCGHVQHVPGDKPQATIRCDRCGAAIPTPRKSLPLAMRTDS